jgi:prophage regulatory protein
MEPAFYRLADIATTPTKIGILPVSPATIWRWVQSGKFPKPIKLGPRVTAWHKADIEHFIAAQTITATK